jgi:hypothetical protein
MPLLVIFVLAFLAFIVVLVALTIATIAESQRQWRQQQEAAVHNATSVVGGGQAFSAISVADAFESETAILWETQIPALALIESAGWHGLDLENLRPLYVRCTRRFPELYEGSDFEAWVQFLQEAELIVLSGATVAITPAGKEFLECRVAAGVAAAQV